MGRISEKWEFAANRADSNRLQCLDLAKLRGPIDPEAVNKAVADLTDLLGGEDWRHAARLMEVTGRRVDLGRASGEGSGKFYYRLTPAGLIAQRSSDVVSLTPKMMVEVLIRDIVGPMKPEDVMPFIIRELDKIADSVED